MIFRAKIEKFIECENGLEQGMPKAYSLIYSTYCTTTMQTRIEEHKDFESTIKNDPIKLLEAIQVLMQNPMQARYPFATMTNAFTKVLNYRQLEGQDLTDFYKERKDAFSVLKTMLGDRFLDGFIERTVEYQELTTDPEKDAMKKEAYEQWCAFLILRNSDQAKYGEVLHDLAFQYSLDNDQYPCKTTKAIECLSNHRHDNAGKPGKNGHGKDQDQASRSGSGNDNGRNSGNGNGTETSFAQQSNKHADKTCYCCGQKGHIPKDCSQKEKPKAQWWINKLTAQHMQHI
jgi:hypothetical protein